MDIQEMQELKDETEKEISKLLMDFYNKTKVDIYALDYKVWRVQDVCGRPEIVGIDIDIGTKL